MSIDKLINKGVVIMDSSEQALVKSIIDSEKSLYKELIKIFDNVTITNGKLSSNQKAKEFLLSLDKKIKDAIKKSGYNKSVNDFLTDFDKIGLNVKELQSKINNVNILASQIDPIKNIEVVNTLDVLLGNKFSANVIAPLQQALYRNIMLGSTVADTEEYLRNYITSSDKKDSKLLRYVKQVSRDAMSQFDGALQGSIASELGLDSVRYVGSIIVDSRAQCRKWVDDGLINLDNSFEIEINKAIDGLLSYEGKSSSGMYADTNTFNFTSYRGGYNCRHRAIPTNSK